MNPQIVLPAVLVVTLVAQALLPRFRLLLVLSGAGIACLLSSVLGLGHPQKILADVPWDVLIILVGLGLLSEVIVESRLFGVLAARACRASGADPRKIAVLFTAGMYLHGGLVNNLTALLIIMPMLLGLFKLIGVKQRYVTWTIGLLLVTCNLGGAATPIGDFPAVLLLGQAKMSFTQYLVRALPTTLAGLLVIMGLVIFVVRPERGLTKSPVAAAVTVDTMSALYRNVRVDRRTLLPAALSLAGMVLAWTLLPPEKGATPELVCWIGAAVALAAKPSLGERLLRRKVDIEATLFLLALFVMVVAVRHTGIFATIAQWLMALPISPTAQLIVFVVAAGLLTSLFSAGPSMAALLEVADALVKVHPANTVYVGLALGVCAGSSLFTTAATSGPLAQALTERADLHDDEGNPLRFGFMEFLPVGIMSFLVIEAIAIVYCLVTIA
ncbi:MAG TPA: SLC13 family permease [Labilithrix sp.]|jgi:Na+/H+ antiporter NhaD/arsenite permease-like protein